MVKWGTISPQDMKLFRFSDNVEETFQYLKQELQKNYFKL